MVGVYKTIDTREDVSEEGPCRVHGLARDVRRVWFADPSRHFIKLFTLVVGQDPTREVDGVRVPAPVQPVVTRHRIRHEFESTDSPLKERTSSRGDKDDHRWPRHAFTSAVTVAEQVPPRPRLPERLGSSFIKETGYSCAAPAVAAGFGYRAGRWLGQDSGVVPYVAAWAADIDRRQLTPCSPWPSRTWPSVGTGREVGRAEELFVHATSNCWRAIEYRSPGGAGRIGKGSSCRGWSCCRR